MSGEIDGVLVSTKNGRASRGAIPGAAFKGLTLTAPLCGGASHSEVGCRIRAGGGPHLARQSQRPSTLRKSEQRERRRLH